MKLANIILNLLMPEKCITCGEERAHYPLPICSRCRSEVLRDLSYPRTVLNRGVEVVSCWRYRGKTALCIQNFKYKKELRLLRLFSSAIKQIPGIMLPDIIIPVPLHRKKLQKRGYDQVSLLSNTISRIFNRPLIENCLVKSLNTPDQTSSTRKMRIENLANAFEIATPEVIANKEILLVDDVITTGATLQKCANMLLSKGARKVRAITLAKA